MLSRGRVGDHGVAKNAELLRRVVVGLVSARKEIDRLLDREQEFEVITEHLNVALIHADRALDAAILAAVSAGIPIAEIEHYADVTVLEPEYFED